MAKKLIIADNTFLFTGKLTEFTREEAEAHVEAEGGKVLSGVSAKLNYLVVGEDAGSKLAKAEALGTVIILTEKDFLKMMKKNTASKSSTIKTSAKKTTTKKTEKIVVTKTAAKTKVESKDSKSINEVTIGKQVWMTRNLDVDCFRNGDKIIECKTDEEWKQAGENKMPAWCNYENKTINGEIYGKLYNWFAVTDPRGLAPEGWNMPTHDDWDTLIANLGGDMLAGSKMKEKGIKNWKNPNEKANNQSKITAIPGGYRYAEDGFNEIGEKVSFWSCSEFNSLFAKERSIMNTNTNVILNYRDKRQGSSVRCVKNFFEPVKSIKIENIEVFQSDIGEFSFYDAKLECAKIGGGWRVPTKEELNLLYQNKEKIGGFTHGFYWSSTNGNPEISFGWGQRFSDGFQNLCSITPKFRNYVRPIRTKK